MKYHIHIPKLLEFALNVVCDDVTLHGKQFLKTSIPYPLYLRCIVTYADKYDAFRYSIFKFYRDVRSNVDVNVQIGRLYPNVLDHIVLDDDDVNAELIMQVAQSKLVDDAAASIQRFASRCLAADKSESMVNAMSQAFRSDALLSKPIIDVLFFYDAKLDPNDRNYFNIACRRGVNDDVQQCIENRQTIDVRDILASIESGNGGILRLLLNAYREVFDLDKYSRAVGLANATVQSMDLLLSLNIIQRRKHYEFSNIPSFSVLQWILDHDVMEHDRLLIDIASNASRYSGHYFDMLRYLIEQRNITVPRDVVLDIYLNNSTNLDVLDYVLWHGSGVNSSVGLTVLEHSPMLIRYWIDNGLIVKTNSAIGVENYISHGMTAPVLDMMIDKYSMDVNADDREGYTALHQACALNDHDVVEMLLSHGADVNKTFDNRAPYEMTTDDRIKQLLIHHGYVPR